MVAMASKARLLGRGRGFVYAVHDHRAPSDEEWGAYLAACSEVIANCPDPQGASALAITDGGAPNAEQRRAVVALVQQHYGKGVERIRSAVVSDSAVVRGVVTAFSWHIPEIRIFAPVAIDPALEHARLASADFPIVLSDLEELATTVRNARAARMVAERLRALLP